MTGLGGGEEINDKTPDVEDVNKGDGPLEDGGGLVDLLVVEDAEGDDESDLDEDEGEFDPEAQCEDALAAVVDAEALVFGADEDGGDDVGAAVGDDWLGHDSFSNGGRQPGLLGFVGLRKEELT